MSSMLLAAFILGLASSGHCLGMCGPIALAVPVRGDRWVDRLISAVVLNGGRLLSYAIVGAAFGAFGRGLALAGAQRWISIILGVAVFAVLLLPDPLKGRGPANWIGGALSNMQGSLARNLRRTSFAGLIFSGMLNGLLPCGMVYLAIAGALTQEGWSGGSAFMVFFGLGTWPALIALRIAGHHIPLNLRLRLRRLAPVAYALMGAALILRGLDLGIPYLSPLLPDVPMAVQACDPGVAPR